jgi:hypothetical protein
MRAVEVDIVRLVEVILPEREFDPMQQQDIRKVGAIIADLVDTLTDGKEGDRQ